jgi:hypothetical protein
LAKMVPLVFGLRIGGFFLPTMGARIWIPFSLLRTWRPRKCQVKPGDVVRGGALLRDQQGIASAGLLAPFPAGARRAGGRRRRKRSVGWRAFAFGFEMTLFVPFVRNRSKRVLHKAQRTAKSVFGQGGFSEGGSGRTAGGCRASRRARTHEPGATVAGPERPKSGCQIGPNGKSRRRPPPL